LQGQPQKSLLAEMLNINSVLTDAAAAMVDDSFLKCFTSAAPDPWNWNLYLAPLWYASAALTWQRGALHLPARMSFQHL